MKTFTIVCIVVALTHIVNASEIAVMLYQGKGPVDFGGYTYKVSNEIKRFNSVYCKDGQILADGIPLYSDQVDFEPYETRMYFQGRHYRGKMRVFTDFYTMTVVNILTVEEYLKGVLPMEVSSDWPMETLKAQAVAARTFAYKRMEETVGKPFNVDASHFSQVYGGVDVEREGTNTAVDATTGVVMTYNGALITAFYHSASGGRTATSDEVWSGTPLPYLKSINDPHSLEAPHQTWVYYINRDRLLKILKINSLIEIKMTYTASGRVSFIRFFDADGKEKSMTGNAFRLAIGSTNLRSTMFSSEISGTVVKFIGRGWGHGVGMSQWGAYAMANKGYTYDAILSFYYSGIQLKKRD